MVRKIYLCLVPFFVGLSLTVYSWFATYPILLHSVDDLAFNNVSSFYWVGLPILLSSTFALILLVKNNPTRCALVIFLVLSMYSLPFYYSSFPGSDAHYFQGLTEHLVQTGSLSPSTPSRYYYEYPAFFVLADLVVFLTGLDVSIYAFLFYAVAVAVLAFCIYKYANRFSRLNGFVAVLAFFIVMFYFVNLQFAPFTLALALLFVAIVVDAYYRNSLAKALVLLLLFVGIVLSHSFVPLFFVFYKLFSFVLERRRSNLLFFVSTGSLYLGYQLLFAPLTFWRTMANLVPNYEYSVMVEATLTGATVPIDVVAQTMSRTVVVATFLIIFLGFVLMFLNKRTKLPVIDKALLLTGIFYVSVGFVVDVLGSRALPLLCLAGSLGAVYLLGTRYRKIVLAAFLIVATLFVFLPMHQSFYDGQVFFQSGEENSANNFVLSNYPWSEYSTMLAHYRVVTYFWAKQASNATIESDFSTPFPNPDDFYSVFCTLGLEKNLERQGYSINDILDKSTNDLIYDNGLSRLVIKGNS